MSDVDLSIIIPSKDNNKKTADIIQNISRELNGIEAEFIVIDMNSSDNSVIYALDVIKNNNLRGCVIQSGGGNVSSALNTGIYKSDGKYITFVYPTRLYKNYIHDYFRTAEKNSADFVFAVPSSIRPAVKQVDAMKNSDDDCIDSRELIFKLVRSLVYFDFTAVMLRREFLLNDHIRFYEDCNYGYVEAFIYNVLLAEPKISYSDISLERDSENEVTKEEATVSVNCYDRIEAIKKVYDNVRLNCGSDKELIEVFEYQKLPSVVMAVSDLLMKEDFSVSVIKKAMKSKGYDKLLKFSKCTSPRLRNKIFKWKTTPWLYKLPDLQ